MAERLSPLVLTSLKCLRSNSSWVEGTCSMLNVHQCHTVTRSTNTNNYSRQIQHTRNVHSFFSIIQEQKNNMKVLIPHKKRNSSLPLCQEEWEITRRRQSWLFEPSTSPQIGTKRFLEDLECFQVPCVHDLLVHLPQLPLDLDTDSKPILKADRQGTTQSSWTMTHIMKPKLLWSCTDMDRQQWHRLLCWEETPGTNVIVKLPRTNEMPRTQATRVGGCLEPKLP